MKKFFSWLIMVMCVILILLLLSFSLFAIYLNFSKTEVNRYSINSEISHCDYSYSKGNMGVTYSKYIISVRNEEFTHTFEVSSIDYAKYKEGDFVNVEVIIFEDKTGAQIREYKILE